MDAAAAGVAIVSAPSSGEGSTGTVVAATGTCSEVCIRFVMD